MENEITLEKTKAYYVVVVAPGVVVAVVFVVSVGLVQIRDSQCSRLYLYHPCLKWDRRGRPIHRPQKFFPRHEQHQVDDVLCFLVLFFFCS